VRIEPLGIGGWPPRPIRPSANHFEPRRCAHRTNILKLLHPVRPKRSAHCCIALCDGLVLGTRGQHSALRCLWNKGRVEEDKEEEAGVRCLLFVTATLDCPVATLQRRPLGRGPSRQHSTAGRPLVISMVEAGNLPFVPDRVAALLKALRA
jgi:hypothetical protein